MQKDFITATPDSGGIGSTTVTAAANSATSTRTGTATYIQATSGKTQAVSLSQAAVVITYKYRIEPELISVSNAQYGSVTKTVLMYKERYVNGVKDGEEQIEYSLLDQSGSYAPVTFATYTNVWNGTWTIEKTGNSLKVTTISGGGNPFGGNNWNEIDAWNQLCWDNKYRFKFGSSIISNKKSGVFSSALPCRQTINQNMKTQQREFIFL